MAAGRPRLRLMLRLAWRTTRQAPLRSALIVLLISIPTFGLAGVATVATSMIPSRSESLKAELGSTQAHLVVVSPPDATLVQSPNSVHEYQSGKDDGRAESSDDDPLVSPYSYLPADRLLTLRSTTATARTAGGTGSFAVTQGDAWNAAFAGRYARVSGSTPATAREVMATPALLARLGAHIGSTVSITQPKALRLTVVGVLRDLTQPTTNEQLFTAPRVIDPVDPRTDPTGTDYFLTGAPVSWSMVKGINTHGAVVLSRVVVDNPPADSPLPLAGATLQPQLLIVLPLAGFALLEVVLLAGAAFMVGARRDERTLAMLGCIGATRTALFGIVIASGVVLGAVGGLIGAAAGVAGAAVFVRVTSDGSTTQYPGFHPWPGLLAGIVLFGMLAGLVAAILPARVASRTNVLAALRGSSRPAPANRRRPIAGLICLAVGAVCLLVGIGLVLAAPAASTDGQGNTFAPPISQLIGAALVFLGPALLQLGVLLLARLLLQRIARIAGRFGVGARLGTQDTARNTSRSVPAVAVIMTTLFVGSLVMTYVTSIQAHDRANWRYEIPFGLAEMDLRDLYASDLPHKAQKVAQLNQALASSFDVRSVHAISATTAYDGTGTDATLFASPVLRDRPQCLIRNTAYDGTRASTEQVCPSRAPYLMAQKIFAGTASDLAVMLGEPVSATSLATLRSGGAVALYPQYVRDGSVTIEWRTAKQLHASSTTDRPLAEPRRTVEVPATVQRPPHDYDFGVFVLTRTARSLGLAMTPSLTLAPLRTPPTERQYDQANAATQAITGGNAQTGSLASVRVQDGPADTGGATAWALLALCALIALAAAAIAIGLSRMEGRRDQWVLTALGASPTLRRSYAFWQTLSITVTGAVLGVLLGITPVLAIALQPGPTAIPFVAPWLQLAAAALGVPLLISAITSTTVRPPRQVTAPIA